VPDSVEGNAAVTYTGGDWKLRSSKESSSTRKERLSLEGPSAFRKIIVREGGQELSWTQVIMEKGETAWW